MRIYPDVQEIKEIFLDKLCEEYRQNNNIDIETCEKRGVKRGLRDVDGTGILAGLTNVCDVIGYDRDENGNVVPIPGKLVYRGIDINDIVVEGLESDRFMFEEVVWLLLLGNLPDKSTLKAFEELLDSHRELPAGFPETQIMAAPSPDIMNKIARSVLAMYSYDENAEDTSLENIIQQSINLIAGIPTMMVYAYQIMRHAYHHESLHLHYPKKQLSTAEHILATYRPNQEFTKEEARLLDLCLVVHADHGGGNNSAFTTRVVSSTGSDTYSAIASSILSLKGPKHGGANLKVMQQLDEMITSIKNVDDDDEVLEYLKSILRCEVGDKSGLIYGMGHAVYRVSDPRAQILKKHCETLAIEKGLEREYKMLTQIEKLSQEAFCEVKGKCKDICANVDLYSGLVYRILGITEELFTPIFAISRCAGWCAHRMEEVEFANRIIRPAYKFAGEFQEYIPLENR